MPAVPGGTAIGMLYVADPVPLTSSLPPRVISCADALAASATSRKARRSRSDRDDAESNTHLFDGNRSRRRFVPIPNGIPINKIERCRTQRAQHHARPQSITGRSTGSDKTRTQFARRDQSAATAVRANSFECICLISMSGGSATRARTPTGFQTDTPAQSSSPASSDARDHGAMRACARQPAHPGQHPA